MLSVTGLKKCFGENTVLDGIELSVERGDVIALLGPSGSGKTTVLRCLNFLERADAGVLDFMGHSFDLSEIRKRDIARIRRQTAFVFQNYNLFQNKTALENVTEGLIVARRMKKEEANKKAREALAKVGLSDKEASYSSQLSGGQQQRVAIARGIVTSPDIIYMDEPTSALDPELIGEVLSVIKTLADEGMTMLIVTHELNFARNVANKIAFMEGGHILEFCETQRFFNESANPRIQAFLKLIGGDTADARTASD